MITRKCTTCNQRVRPHRHCPEPNRTCDWWACPICKALHCHDRTLPHKEVKK